MAAELNFVHPYSGVALSVGTRPDTELVGLFERLGFGSE